MRKFNPVSPGIIGDVEILPDPPELRKPGGLFYRIRCLLCGKVRWTSASRLRSRTQSCVCTLSSQISRRHKDGPPQNERDFVARWAKKESKR